MADVIKGTKKGDFFATSQQTNCNYAIARDLINDRLASSQLTRL
jgi:hypothetical protein